MHGLMMNSPLLVQSLLEFASQFHSDSRVVSRRVSGELSYSNYGEIYNRSKSLAVGLIENGIKSGDRIATLAWNSDRHLELYYAISGIGAVCHTLNLRLGDDDLVYIINHAEDRMLFYDIDLTETVERISPKLGSVEKLIPLSNSEYSFEKIDSINYESLLNNVDDKFVWPEFSENQAAAMCYTSGTTGHPKGVLYSHRSTVLHAMASCFNSTLGLQTDDVIMPVVPMFHVMGWGIPYSAPISGAELVMPGNKLDGKSLFELMDREGVTISLGVPTVWMGLIDYMDQLKRKPKSLTRVVVGGAAVSESMINRFEIDYGVEVFHAWGMTEMSPVGVVNSLKPKFKKISRSKQMPIKLKQGRAVYGVQMRIVDDLGNDLPSDGKSSGRLLVKGPWIIREYYKSSKSALTADGWFDTGDIATLDSDGYMNITDRSKDVIKSGGEWISSVGLENVAMGHPAIKQAAVIGVSHPKWQERPILICIPVGNNRPTLDQIHDYLKDKVPKLWMPNAVEWVDELPLGSTGKILKNILRDKYKNYSL